MTEVKYFLLKDMITDLKATGLVVSGTGFTLTSVDVVEGDGGDYSHAVWAGECQIGNWVFEGGAVPTFHVGINNPYNTPMVANINMEISTDKMTFVTSSSKTVTLQPNNPQRIEALTVEGLQPGIYHATITVNDDLARGFFFAVRPMEIVSAPDKQSDFDSYWQKAKEQLAAVPINATLTEIPAKSSARRKVYLVEMQSIADGLTGAPVTIRGYYAEPTDGKKHPVLIHFQGYDSEYRPGGDSATPWCMNAKWDTEESANFAEFILSNRGQSVNNRPASDRDDGIQKDFVNIYGDWFAYQFGNKDCYYYRGAYMDCLRVLDFMASRQTSDMQNLFAEGQSQGGAFTIAAAALSAGRYTFSAIAPAISFMGDFPDYFEIVSWPGHVAKNCQAEINKNGGSMTDEDMYAILSYYDTKNLATSISCPIITSVGLQDNVCPPHTNLAPYNNVQTAASEKKVIFNAELSHATNTQWNTTYQTFFKQYLTATDGITETTSDDQTDHRYYDLQGRPVANPAQGLYIVHKRKVVMK